MVQRRNHHLLLNSFKALRNVCRFLHQHRVAAQKFEYFNRCRLEQKALLKWHLRIRHTRMLTSRLNNHKQHCQYRLLQKVFSSLQENFFRTKRIGNLLVRTYKKQEFLRKQSAFIKLQAHSTLVQATRHKSRQVGRHKLSFLLDSMHRQ